MTEIKFGNAYIDGKPIEPGGIYLGSPELVIGDTSPEMESLKWVYDINGNFVSTGYACVNISWNDLERQGYISGRPVFVDGKGYLCRCLCVGGAKDDINEWDDLLDRYGDAPEFWNTRYHRFWGRESIESGDSRMAVLRGGSTARTRSQGSVMNRSGFRPVLVPLRKAPTLDSNLIGMCLKVYGPHGIAIMGMLAGFDDYDLTIATPDGFNAQAKNWAVQKGNVAVVSRSSVVWMDTVPAIPAREVKSASSEGRSSVISVNLV